MLPSEYAIKVLDGTATKLREFENSEFLIFAASENGDISYRSDGKIITRLAFIQIQLRQIEQLMIAEATQIGNPVVLNDLNITLQGLLKISQNVSILAKLRLADEATYGLSA